MKSYTVSGFYGCNKEQNKADVFVYEINGLHWYCIDGSQNVNATYNPIEEGVDVEILEDVDTFTTLFPVESLEDLEQEVDEMQ